MGQWSSVAESGLGSTVDTVNADREVKENVTDLFTTAATGEHMRLGTQTLVGARHGAPLACENMRYAAAAHINRLAARKS